MPRDEISRFKNQKLQGTQERVVEDLSVFHSVFESECTIKRTRKYLNHKAGPILVKGCLLINIELDTYKIL